MSAAPAAAPTPLLLILATKHEFVRTNLEAGKVPTASMLASFLQALVHELGPHVKAAPLALSESLKSGLASLGWSVAPNSPAPGSAPPQVQDVLGFLDGVLAEWLPDLPTARAAAAQAARRAGEEERELGLMEEESLDGSLSGKQQKAHAASQARLPQLQQAAAAAGQLVRAIEARLCPEERAAADAADEAQRGVEALRIAQLTKEAAEAAAGGGGKGSSRGGGKGRGGGSSRGGGSGRNRGDGSGGWSSGGGGGEPLDREARAAAAAARADAKAAADASAADAALAALRASDISLVEASELRKGGHVLLPVAGRDEPCRIVELSTSKTGKHGHAKISVTATDVASGRKVERNLRADERVTVPGKRWVMAVSPV